MTKNNSFIKRQVIWIFFALTFFITWGSMAIVVGPEGFPISTEQFEKSGPLVYLAMLVGPSLAGILMIAITSGKAGLNEFRSRLFKWQVSPLWYLVALLATPLLATVILLTLSLISVEFVPAIFTSTDKTSLLLTGITTGLIVGFFEEVGWTGFIVPRMKVRYGIITTGLTVGLLWGAWHFPVFWENGSFSASLPLALLVGRLFFWLPPYRILMVWVFQQTNSLLIPVLMHASLVASMSIIVPAELTELSILTWITVWTTALWSIVAAIVTVRQDRSLEARGWQTDPLKGEY